ncbi:MAG: AraC family ligand binding domain-containing protein [Chloroflexota bacterium]|nr:AraC family ligand binding domain-containing protein [Chloroflexota bacterium]
MATPERPPGQTSGSAQRPPHELSGPVTVLDLLDEAHALRREPAWTQGDRNAKTFIKEADLRVVLTVLKHGAIIREHQAPGTAVVQVLTGRVRLRVPGQDIELPAGRLLILERDLPHDVEALEESAFVISIGWSGGQRGDVR